MNGNEPFCSHSNRSLSLGSGFERAMVRKCRGIAEVAGMEVAQVGVRTRAQAALDVEATRSRSAKRRNVGGGEGELKISKTPYVSRKRRVSAEQNSIPLTTPEERNSGISECSSPSLDQVPVYCCSSNRSGELVGKRIDFFELEDVCAEVEASAYNCGRERRETTPTSQLREEIGNMSNGGVSTTRQTEEISRRRLIPANTPTESEIEEFFTAAEEDLRKRFAEKYNFDIVKDEPLEGRYEWVRLKP